MTRGDLRSTDEIGRPVYEHNKVLLDCPAEECHLSITGDALPIGGTFTITPILTFPLNNREGTYAPLSQRERGRG